MKVVSSNTVLSAFDAGYAYPLTSSGTECREVVQLAYTNIGSDSAAIPQYLLLNSSDGPGPEADGTYDITTHNVFPMLTGPTGMNAASQGVFFPCWPTHAKTNLAGRFIIPPGWLLVTQVIDGDMTGTVRHLCITQVC